MTTTLRVGLVAMACLCAAMHSEATEGGGGAYPNGAEGFMTGAVPPPGHYLINYALYYGADKLAGPDGQSLVPGFDLEVWGDVLRYIHVTDRKILGAYWAQHIFVPLLYVDVTIPGAGSDDAFGLGDVIVDPMILAWHGPNWHAAAGVDIFVPVGKYDKDRLANIGRNYWTFEPVFAATYFCGGGWETSAKFMYDINLENDDTKVTSGDEFHVDWAVGRQMGAWKFGVGGYYYKQVSSDDYPADYVGLPFGRGQAIGLGPQVAYSAGAVQFILKVQDELEVENRPEGEKVWFKCVLPL